MPPRLAADRGTLGVKRWLSVGASVALLVCGCGNDSPDTAVGDVEPSTTSIPPDQPVKEHAEQSASRFAYVTGDRSIDVAGRSIELPASPAAPLSPIEATSSIAATGELILFTVFDARPELGETAGIPSVFVAGVDGSPVVRYDNEHSVAVSRDGRIATSRLASPVGFTEGASSELVVRDEPLAEPVVWLEPDGPSAAYPTAWAHGTLVATRSRGAAGPTVLLLSGPRNVIAKIDSALLSAVSPDGSMVAIQQLWPAVDDSVVSILDAMTGQVLSTSPPFSSVETPYGAGDWADDQLVLPHARGYHRLKISPDGRSIEHRTSHSVHDSDAEYVIAAAFNGDAVELLSHDFGRPGGALPWTQRIRTCQGGTCSVTFEREAPYGQSQPASLDRSR